MCIKIIVIIFDSLISLVKIELFFDFIQEMGRKLADPFSQICQNGSLGRKSLSLRGHTFSMRFYVYMCEVVYNSSMICDLLTFMNI